MKNIEAWENEQEAVFLAHKDELGEQRARCLSNVWANKHFLGCRYAPQVEALIEHWPVPKKLAGHADAAKRRQKREQESGHQFAQQNKKRKREDSQNTYNTRAIVHSSSSSSHSSSSSLPSSSSSSSSNFKPQTSNRRKQNQPRPNQQQPKPRLPKPSAGASSKRSFPTFARHKRRQNSVKASFDNLVHISESFVAPQLWAPDTLEDEYGIGDDIKSMDCVQEPSEEDESWNLDSDFQKIKVESPGCMEDTESKVVKPKFDKLKKREVENLLKNSKKTPISILYEFAKKMPQKPKISWKTEFLKSQKKISVLFHTQSVASAEARTVKLAKQAAAKAALSVLSCHSSTSQDLLKSVLLGGRMKVSPEQEEDLQTLLDPSSTKKKPVPPQESKEVRLHPGQIRQSYEEMDQLSTPQLVGQSIQNAVSLLVQFASKMWPRPEVIWTPEFKATHRCTVCFGRKRIGTGSGRTAKFAKQSAARAALMYLSKNSQSCEQLLRSILLPPVMQDPNKVVQKNDILFLGDPLKCHPIGPDNIGRAMMLKLGWEGGGLGLHERGPQLPVSVILDFKIDTLGLGHRGLPKGEKGVSKTNEFKVKGGAHQQIIQFLQSDETELQFTSDLEKGERAIVHKLAIQFNLRHKSIGKGANRFLTVSKKSGKKNAVVIH